MRNGFLALLGILAASGGAALAQQMPTMPYYPMPNSMGPAYYAPAAYSPGGAYPQPGYYSQYPVCYASPAPVVQQPHFTPPTLPASPSVAFMPDMAPGFTPPTFDPAAAPAFPPAAEPIAPSRGGGASECGPDYFWMRAEYLMWWTKGSPVPIPIVTTGPANAPVVGGLGQNSTQILFGNSSQEYGATSGLRFDTGLWLNQDRSFGVEAGYFLLERRATGFGIASDAGGNPVIAQPLVDPRTSQEYTELTALPNFITGNVSITTHSRLQGWELNAAVNACRGSNFSLDFLAGARVVNLDEDFLDFNAFAPLQDQFLTFLGAPINRPSSETTTDHFSTQNHFYGPQLGTRLDWNNGRLNLRLLGKCAVGVNQQLARVDGSTALITPGAATTTAPGGVLAVASNSGRFFRDQISVVPEVGLQVAYSLTNHIEASVGYSFLYWDNVVRPGNQLDRTVEPSLVPSDPSFGATTGTRPAFQFHNSDYWAHGVNFGLAFRY